MKSSYSGCANINTLGATKPPLPNPLLSFILINIIEGLNHLDSLSFMAFSEVLGYQFREADEPSCATGYSAPWTYIVYANEGSSRCVS